MRMAIAMGVAVLLGACATMGSGGPASGGDVVASAALTRIDYETGPCFGTCPVYSLSIAPDGSGRFSGKRFTAVTGERTFTATPAQFAAFEAALAPHRPASGSRRFSHGEPGCTNAPTDMPSVSVKWSATSGDAQTLYYYFGCDGENPGKSAQLRAAVDALLVTSLIGKR